MYYQMYRKNVEETLDAIFTKETDGLEKAGQMLAQVLENDGLLYVFGCGHSHMLAEELFYRAGGLAPVYPIFETAAMLHEGAAKSSQIERMSGYAQHVIARYPIGPKDCLPPPPASIPSAWKWPSWRENGGPRSLVSPPALT